MTGVFDWIDVSARRRDRAGLTRRMLVRPARSALVDLAGNDYLGLARHPEVTGAAAEAALVWGSGATAARLVSGTTVLHRELEEELADFCGAEAALVFSSGYLANLGMITALSRPGTLLVVDAGNHASLIDGYKLAGAQVQTVAHNSPQAVEKALADTRSARVHAVTESVFSVDGDLADLPATLEACRRHNAALLVDDAHGIGVVGERGEGAVAAAGLAGAPDVVWTLTLSKALGSQGGAVLGPRRVIDHVMNTARSFLFDTGLAPAPVAGALTALRVLRDRPDLPARTRRVAAGLHTRLREAGLTVSPPEGAVVSVLAPSAEAAVAWADACRSQGVAVSCFRPPSVPDRFSRLRLTARADLTDADVERAVEVILAARPAGG
ncbi:8-amino-7-oxononanoate synthase [Streptosporangium becharense]|uniref:8-amino-7-oxononanoate synthase n=1 Tax=Streptosporangium becharense TaxID=1816182 RepID=A0A7W9ILQ8_9ACTN|nr:8-amino-7-oxononanoate synthase [Streptosporangium becharense]MBB2910234.1 8-amino-7-oxononanoate synthase [Streptosporangium becharense]MBB5822977.1 8-amino-7-oxononanoate synthase [Streptosporangium becharense]